MRTFRVIEGDCLEVLKAMPDASIDACVTDPPYELGFMGKKWDASGIAYNVELWREILRVLKPGAHLLSFGGTRTYHRMACAIEDGGFLIEDCIMWVFGQGFPKHKSKLKPAYEPILVARKGGASHLNVDACRIPIQGEIDPKRKGYNQPGNGMGTGEVYEGGWSGYKGAALPHPDSPRHDARGRWPANVILDEEAAEMLDLMSGERRSAGLYPTTYTNSRNNVYSPGIGKAQGQLYEDSGGASRFFYCAKADRDERDAGLDGLPLRPITERDGRNHSLNSGLRMENGVPTGPKADSSKARNHHPTVKPLSLMCWLVRLVTPAGGVVLDPFTGSGSTGIAALREGFQFIGIERESEYVEIARQRIIGDAPLFNSPAA